MTTMTVRRAKAIREPGRYRAGETLYLRVRPSGRKSWVQRITIDGVRRDINIGPFDLVTLVEARMKAEANRWAIFQGRDPLAERLGPRGRPSARRPGRR